ncbi:MAG: pseudouridine synthase [Clostridia bacterium]|nr:pseudouridine synthase [Clostridia bacterium]
MRLDKFLAGCGYGTRREVKALVKSGAVSVNGVTERDGGKNVSESDNITVGGNSAVYKEFVYIMLNKPQGYVSATEDRHYPVVTELIGEEYAHFKPAPVGRLDIDTEGLLLLTNDGDLNHRLTSPSKHVDKTYFAVLDKPAEASDTDAFAAGMEFKDFTARSAKLEICENRNEVFVTISEGKYHQVKRMCERVGKKVTYLKRISMGGLKLDPKLAPGEYRELTPNELEMLN